MRQRFEEFIEISQYVIYTYLSILAYGDFTTGKAPSEILSSEEISDLMKNSEKL
ncbi:MAG: hypothetical protein QW154_03880 [Sulfolobales archaeon]